MMTMGENPKTETAVRPRRTTTLPYCGSIAGWYGTFNCAC